MNLAIPDDDVQVVIEALRYYAHMEAGQTQAPDLMHRDDFYQWDLAAKIERSLERSQRARRVHEQEP